MRPISTTSEASQRAKRAFTQNGGRAVGGLTLLLQAHLRHYGMPTNDVPHWPKAKFSQDFHKHWPMGQIFTLCGAQGEKNFDTFQKFCLF